MAPNHGRDPLGSILGSMGSHWVKEIGQNRKKLPCPKIRIFGYPAVILGPMGSHWVKKMGQNRKNYHAPKFEFLATPVIYFWQKIEVTVMAPNHGADDLGSILGPMGSHWVQKMGQNRKKLPCPKIRIFGHRFFAKNRSYGYGANSRWRPPRVHLGANGVPLGKKMGQNRKKLPCPKIRIFGYPASSIFRKKSKLRL